MPDAAVEVVDLVKRYGANTAVDGLCLTVARGSITAVLGPNGAGKTTVLDLISGRTKASAGEVKFNGHQLTNLREHEIVRLGVGRKFQTPSVYESLTVRENLEMSYPKGRTVFGAWAFKRTSEIDEKVTSVAKTIHLDHRLHESAELLSHGEKQWLEIGMLLIQDPELMMLDEPVAGMSVNEREMTAELIKTISKGRALLVVEHDMEFVKRIAHVVTVLHQGKLLAEGKMEKVQEDPRVIEVYLGH